MQVSRGGVLNNVTVCTVGSEPRRGSLSDRILIAVKPVRRLPNRTHAPSSLQNIRPSSDVHTAFSTVNP
jgi:hypothetical protein